MSTADIEPQPTRLEEVVHGLLSGASSVEELVSALDFTRESLESLRNDFRTTAQSEGEVTGQVIGNEIEAVEQSFRDYFAVLDSCAGYLHAFDRLYLESTGDYLRSAIERLNLDFLRFREAALAQRGPTTHPGLNLMYCLASVQLKEDSESHEAAFEAQKLVEEARCQASLGGLDLDPSMALLAPSLKCFYTDYLELLTSDAPLEEWLPALLELGKSHSRVDVNFLSKRFGFGPTPVPSLNMVIHSAWLLTQDSVEPDVLPFFLVQAEQAVHGAAEAHQQMLLSLDDNDPNRPGAVQIKESFQALSECLEAYWSWSESADPETLHALYEQVLGPAQGVQAAFAAMNSRATGSSGVACLICGCQHQAGERRCRQCGAALPAVQEYVAMEGEASTAKGLATASRFQRLLDAAWHVLDHGDRPDTLLDLLEEMDKALELARKSQGSPEGQSDPLSQAAQTYAQGVEEVSTGLDLLREFAANPDRELLEEASTSLEQAAQLLQEAQKELAPLSGTRKP